MLLLFSELIVPELCRINNGERGGRVVRKCWVNFQCQGILLIWIIVGQGLIVFAVGAGRGYLDFFFSHLLLFFLPLSGRWPAID